MNAFPRRASTLLAALGLSVGLSAVAAGPAAAQSFSDALRQMQRDLGDLLGSSDERRRMIRRTSTRKSSYRRRFDFAAPDDAPLPRMRPTPEELAEARANRPPDAYYEDQGYGAPEPGPAVAGQGEVDSVGYGREWGAGGDPLVELLGPDGAVKRVDASLRLSGPETPKAVALSESAAVEARSIAAAAREAAAAARAAAAGAPGIVREDGAPAKGSPDAPVEARAAATPVAAAAVAEPAERSSDAQPISGPSIASSVVSDPTLRIALAFLVGAGLLGLAILREWRSARRSAE